MTKYAVSVGDREYEVEIRDSHFLVDGQPLSFELTSLNGNGLHLLRQGERSTEMYFRVIGKDGYEVSVEGHRLMARVDRGLGGARRRRSLRRAESAAGDVVAPMPGLIVDVPVAVGARVEAGEVLLVQESMKMQMQLRSPCSGTVDAVRAAVGDQVEKGQLLVRVRPDDPVSPPSEDRDEPDGSA